jgi:hypothetical protein
MVRTLLLRPILCRDWRLHQQVGPPLPGHPTGVPGVPPRRRLPDPGVLRTVTPRRRAQGADAGSGSYPSRLLADIVVAIPAADLAVEAVV